MTTPASDQTEVDKLSLVVSFEGVHGILVDIHAYVFDPSGELVARQMVRKGRVVIPVDLRVLSHANVVLLPPVDDLIEGPITLSKIRTFHAFESECRLDSGLKVHFLPEVPESVWRWWLVHSLWKTLNMRADWQPAALIL